VFTLVDPVVGDDGLLYKTYTPALSEKMKGLVRYADILTPNLTELCALTGTEYRDGNFNNTELENLCQQLSSQGPEHIVVTGIHCEDRQIMNFVYSKGEKPKTVMVDRIGGDRSGTGDVISAVIAGMYLNGHDFYDSVKRSTEFASKCVAYCEEQHVPTHWGLSVEMFLRDLMED
jgi:pyridoxine kinase